MNVFRTTKAKALAVRSIAEKMVTRAKNDNVHSRRIIARAIKDKEILNKLFTEIGPRFKDRSGGYTRVMKLGQRHSDASEMVIFEFVERTNVETSAHSSSENNALKQTDRRIKPPKEKSAKKETIKGI